MEKRVVPFFKLSLDEREIDAVVRILRKGYLTMGKETRALEKAFSYFVGSKYAVAVDSCTSGLFLSLKCNGIGPGNKVKIPSLTFASVANVILHCNADIEWEDEIHVGRAYHLKNNRPYRIVDAAHQIERAMFRSFTGGTLMSFSFYPTKQLSSAEGGMICTSDHAAMEWLENARWNGRKGGGFNYEIVQPGWKMNMTDVQAVIALVQLEKLDEMNRRRRIIVDYYNRELRKHVDSLHLYTINVNERDDFIKAMDELGVNCSVHFYTPLHQQPAYIEYKRCLPLSEFTANHTVSLPLYADMHQEDCDYVIALVKEWEKEKGICECTTI